MPKLLVEKAIPDEYFEFACGSSMERLVLYNQSGDVFLLDERLDVVQTFKESGLVSCVAANDRAETVAISCADKVSLRDWRGLLIASLKHDDWGGYGSGTCVFSGSNVVAITLFSDRATLSLIDTRSNVIHQAPIDIDISAHFFMQWHPDARIIGISAIAGDEGGWMRWARVSEDGIQFLSEYSIDDPDPFCLLDIAPDGREFVCVQCDLRRFRFPTLPI